MPLFHNRSRNGAGSMHQLGAGSMLSSAPGSAMRKSPTSLGSAPINGPKPITPMTFAPGMESKPTIGATLKQKFEQKKSVTPNWQTGNVNGFQQSGWNK